MQQKQAQYIIKGMQRDLSISKASSEYSYENVNIRLTARENSTLLSATNEKGNKEILLDTVIDGTLIGNCTLNNYMLLFTKGTKDNIYRIEYRNNNYTSKLLYSGNLNFDVQHPLESISVYENENIQKVYWTDGLNQPCVINIVATDAVRAKWNDNSFQFIKHLKLEEDISVSRNIVANGIFAPGVLQYACTYYNKYGQESNIFYTSPLLYVSYNNRGASPEDKVGNSFNISMQKLDRNFEYVRIYSILRTSIDATPEVKRVVDIAIPESGSKLYTDNGTVGDIIDPAELLYIGGEEIVAKTMTHKDNTLFLGNIELKKKMVSDNVRNFLKGKPITFDSTTKKITPPLATGYYPYSSQLKLSSEKFRTFKYLEWYRFGIQLQHKSGRWSEPVWINDAQNTAHVYSSFILNSDVKLPIARFNILDSNANIIESIKNDDFVNIRPVIVYPNLTDRDCICQGVLCPTVYNVNDRYGNSPFAQSSWFIRPNAAYDEYKAFNYKANSSLQSGYEGDWNDRDSAIHQFTINSRAGVMSNTRIFASITDGGSTTTKNMDMVNKGIWAEFRHNYPIPSNDNKKAEIQCIYNPPASPYLADSMTDSDITGWVTQNSENYYIDQSILTFHSPDIEFDDSVRSIDTSGLKLRIVGLVPMTGFSSDIDIQTSTPANTFYKGNAIAPGFYKEPVGVENISRYGWKGLMSGAFWFDDITGYKDNKTNSEKLSTGFVVYPWHRNGSLNNTKVATDGYRSAMLDKKKLSNLRYSYNSYYLDSNLIWKAYVNGDNNHTGISGISIFDSNEVSLIRIPSPENSGLNDINYYGNIDKVLTVSRTGDKKEGYPIVTTGVQNAAVNPHILFCSGYSKMDSTFTDQITGTDPVRMRYKSTAHAVLALNYTKSGAQNILPTVKDGDYIYPAGNTWNVNYVGGLVNAAKHSFWDTKKKTNTINQDILDFRVNLVLSDSGLGHEYGFLWLAELYNDNVLNRFGGTTEEAFENNQWLPCGKAVSLFNLDGTLKTSLEVTWTDGDTYYQRYDHLKTYPFSLEEQNAVTDIVSFMCETRVNLDGRYDRNRGQTSNLTTTPTNFNKMNAVYSQRNNFFNYRGLNHDKFNIDYFPNTLTWTKEKQIGGITDLWTNITMAATLDLDGDKGEITSLNTYNNEIFCFQRSGFSNIMFNSRVQIPTSDGVPIEISNGLKVSGKRYMSNNIGCVNKWSIVESPNGIYFIDNLSTAMYLFNGQVSPISDKLGFRQWIGENNSLDVWNPSEFNNFVGYYDKTNNDVYFVNKTSCLCYSESLGQFSSFMSYENVPAMSNLSDKFVSFKDGKLWEQNAGDYNMFFNSFRPYYITYKVNPKEPTDKIFNTVEFRSDTWNDKVLTNSTFDTLEVWNEYQRGVATLKDIKYKPSTLKKKFRIWRANIPRDMSNNRDRIRNPWIFLKLGMNASNTYKTELHDIIVGFFE